MVVGTARDQFHSSASQAVSEGVGIADDLGLIFFEGGLECFAKADCLTGDDMHQRAALGAGEDRLVDCLGEAFTAEDHTASGTAEGLVCSGGDDVRIGNRVGMQSGCDQTGDMRHIHHQVSTAGVSNFSEFGKVNRPRISGSTGDNQFGFMLHCQLHQFGVVDTAGLPVDAIGDDVEVFTGDVDLGAVGQMSTFVQVHAEDGVARFQQCEIDRNVCLCAGMRLNVGVFGAEQLAGTFSGDLFDDVDAFAAAIISFAGVAFRE